MEKWFAQFLNKMKSIVLIEFVLTFLLPYTGQAARWNKRIKLEGCEVPDQNAVNVRNGVLTSI